MFILPAIKIAVQSHLKQELENRSVGVTITYVLECDHLEIIVCLN